MEAVEKGSGVEADGRREVTGVEKVKEEGRK